MGRGSSKVSGDVGLTAAQEKSINKIANRTRNYKNEQYRVISEDGSIVLEKRGGKDAVGATVGEKRDAFWDNDGAISIHNHPEGGTFSPEDLSEFGYGAKAMVVASPEANYTLINSKYNTPDAYKGWRDMRDAYIKATDHQSEFVGIEKLRKLREQAHKVPKIAKADKQTNELASKYLEAYKAGRKQEADKYYRQYERLEKAVKKAVDVEVRKLEVKPYDEFLRKNAKKYGFKYIVSSV